MLGKFVTFEGADGAGKTTAARGLYSFLKQLGRDVILTREPGGTVAAEKIRELLLHEEIAPKAELLLFAAARVEHVERVIKPALRDGYIVLCDRFSDSSFAYQGMARNMIGDVLELERFTLQGFEPDYTLFFDLTLEESMRRIGGRYDESNLFDVATREFKLGVYRGYQRRFKENPQRMHAVNAMGSPEDVFRQVQYWAEKILLPQMDMEQEFLRVEAKVK